MSSPIGITFRKPAENATITDVVREKYGAAARRVLDQVDLVVHGHNHVYKSQLLPGTRTPVIQVASGSRHSTGHMAEFNVYVVENGRLAAIERHVFDPEVDAFVSAHVHTADAA
jgi:UDP-2,3-diacylglucosamine pyrophosphatase LpxH